MEIYDLRTNGEKNPIGIDVSDPSFSWKLRCKDGENGLFQSCYRITVAAEESALERGIPDVWDSGEVFSGETVCIVYKGEPLKEHKRYFWRVEVNGKVSPTAFFETAYLDKAMPHAHWIGMPLAYHGGTDIVRLDFFANKKPVRARFYLAALGCSRCYLNGKLVADAYFDGSISVYRKRVFYRALALDVREGKNALCVELGYGFYGGKKLKGEVYLEYDDGRTEIIPTIAGRLWNVAQGCVTENSIYGGEVFDARRKRDWYSPDYEASISEFVAAYCVEGPAGNLCSCPIPPMTVAEKFIPERVERTAENRVLIDAGKNICGWLRLVLKGERGAKVTVRYAEILGKDGRIDCGNLRTAKSRDVYILGGNGAEEYAPAFTYHGFRYAEIETEGQVCVHGVTAELLRSGAEQCGEFFCTDESLQKLHEMAALTEANNLNGVFTDCPQRDERLGWLNDMSSRIFESVCNFDLRAFLPNFVDMITDSQDESGAFGDTVPFSVGSPVADAVCAYPVLGWIAYKFYGDERVLERNYAGFCRWNDKLSEYEKDGVVEWGIYGDWCPAFTFSEGGDGTHSAQVTPKFMAGAYYIWNLHLTEQVASILGMNDEAARWRERRRRAKEAFFRKYLGENGKIGNGSQTECAVGMTVFPEEKELCGKWATAAEEDIVLKGYHTTCGNQGYRHLFYRLAEAGYTETLCKLLTNAEYPGWGYMLKKGATTVWERWEADVGTDMHSFNHPMFAAYDGFLYNYLAGIRTEECENAFGKIVIEPCFISPLSYVRASLETVRGRIAVEWVREGAKIKLTVIAPANSRLVVRAHGYCLQCGDIVRRDEITPENGFSIIEIRSI